MLQLGTNKVYKIWILLISWIDIPYICDSNIRYIQGREDSHSDGSDSEAESDEDSEPESDEDSEPDSDDDEDPDDSDSDDGDDDDDSPCQGQNFPEQPNDNIAVDPPAKRKLFFRGFADDTSEEI